MSDPPGDHPSPEQLPAYGLGLLDAEATAAIERHVAGCDACCQALLAVADDGLVTRLRQAVSTSSDDPASPNAATLALSAAGAPAPLPPELASHPRYRVEKLLGAGGMGAVYRAHHLVMGRPVALKVINPVLTTKPAMVERFAREGKAAARLSHPNIVTAFDAEQAGSTHFLVMEYVEGTDLARLVAEQGLLPVDRACEYVRQAALGLQHAFEQGMVHRDVKPHNLMLTPSGQVKILDFGLARFASEAASEAGVTASGTVLGTVDYIAPEQADNAHQADIRADIYSLGCTLYHLLAGRPPFPAGTPIQKVMAHIKKIPEPLTAFRQDIPEELMVVLERMMAKDPTRRYKTPAAVAEALRPFIDPAFLSGLRKASPGGRPAPRRGRRIGLAAAVLALLLGGGLLGVAVYRIQTDNGLLVITTEDPDVEVVIKQQGKVVRIVDGKTSKEVKLESGLYDLELKGQPEDLRLSLDRVTIRRGEKVLATIERVGGTEKVGEVRRFEGTAGSVRAVAFTPDGRFLLSCSGPGRTDKMLRLWEVATGKEVRRFEGHTNQVDALAISPDGRLAVSSSEDRTVRVWEIATGREVQQFEGEPGWVVTVAFSPDGKQVLTGSHDNTVRLWDPATGKELRRFEGHEGEVQGVAFAPDGKKLTSASWDKTVRVWEAATGKQLLSLAGHTDIVHGVAFSPDGRRILSGGLDRTVRLWDAESGKELRCFEGHTDRINTVAYSPDGRRALSGSSDHTVRLWDVETGKELGPLGDHREAVWGVAFSPAGAFAASASVDGTVRLWRLPGPRPAAEKAGQVHLLGGHKDYIHGIAVSRDGRYALSGGGWKIRNGKMVPGAKDHDIRLWDLERRTEVRRLTGSQGAVYCVAISPDGSRVLGGSGPPEKGAIRLWDTETGKELRCMEREEFAVWTLDFSPDGRRFLSAASGEPNVFRLWDEDFKELKTFEGHTAAVRRAIFSPDGRRALSASFDGTARLWDVETGKELKRFEGHAGWVYGVAFSPDGRRVLTAGFDHTVRLWDCETGKELKRFEGHKAPVNGVAFSPDGRFALSAGGSSDAADEEDFGLRLWDVDSGKELHRFEGHTDVVSQILWLPDGRHALSSGWDSAVRLWRLPDLPPAARP